MNVMAPHWSQEDDFILTLSDKDELSSSEASDSAQNANIASRESRKRKRQDNTKGPHKKLKNIRSGHDDIDSESDKVVDDGALDSEFEFDINENNPDVVEDFDGWGTAEQTHKTAKSVDVDQIIERRREAQSKKRSNGTPSARQETDNGITALDDGDSVEDEDAGEEIEFEDESIEPATFGTAVDLEVEDLILRNNAKDSTSDMSDNDSENESEEDDTSSVASPAPHPDDLSSAQASDDEAAASESDVEETAKRKAFFAPESDHMTPESSISTSFQQFSISRPLLRALAALSFTVPTPIQTRTIPVALQGLDVVGSAQTGSGKTAAFLLPILERLIYRPRRVPTTRVAILMPTRELAVQCYSVATVLAKFTDISFAQVVGGFSLRKQEVILKKRPDVVIATPGRFIDHMHNSASFAVENLEILVLDEADRMLEQGFANELDEILKTIPRSRQTMLFSATMTDSVDKLVRVGMNKPVRVSVDAKRSTVSGLIQEFVRLRPGREEMRLASLCILCTKIADYKERTIIFFRQKKEAHRIRIAFGLLGVKAGELHGSMTQDQRIAAVNNFRDGKTTHLLATDVASRGLDIKNVISVINYEAPQTHEIYLHRVGRTARAGRSGKACTIAAEPDRKVVKAAVKSARGQGAKIVSRVLELAQVNAMNDQIEGFADEIEEILKEEKQEKQLSQMEAEVSRGQNIVKHHDEIMSRPKRTWFESEKEKQAAKQRAKAELNGVTPTGEKKKLSNKDRKKLDLHRQRAEGRQWKKGKGDGNMVGKESKARKKQGTDGKAKSSTRRRSAR